MELSEKECANIRNILDPLERTSRGDYETAKEQMEIETEAGVRGVTSAYLDMIRNRSTLNKIKRARDSLGKCGCQL